MFSHTSAIILLPSPSHKDQKSLSILLHMYKQFQYIISFNGRTCDRKNIYVCCDVLLLRFGSASPLFLTPPKLKPSLVQQKKQPCVLTFDVIFFLFISDNKKGTFKRFLLQCLIYINIYLYIQQTIQPLNGMK